MLHGYVIILTNDAWSYDSLYHLPRTLSLRRKSQWLKLGLCILTGN